MKNIFIQFNLQSYQICLYLRIVCINNNMVIHLLFWHYRNIKRKNKQNAQLGAQTTNSKTRRRKKALNTCFSKKKKRQLKPEAYQCTGRQLHQTVKIHARVIYPVSSKTNYVLIFQKVAKISEKKNSTNRTCNYKYKRIHPCFKTVNDKMFFSLHTQQISQKSKDRSIQRHNERNTSGTYWQAEFFKSRLHKCDVLT